MKRNSLLVGAFVLVSLLLAVATVLWLSGNSLFSRQVLARMYFQGSGFMSVRRSAFAASRSGRSIESASRSTAARSTRAFRFRCDFNPTRSGSPKSPTNR
jgi:hypothetical protein